MVQPSHAILIVDDEAVLRETLKKILSDEGFTVFAASDGAGALSIATEHEITIALLDIKLPDISGVDVLHRLRALRPNVAAVMMTAYEVESFVNRAFEQGAYTCLHKPFEIDALLKIIDELQKQ